MYLVPEKRRIYIGKRDEEKELAENVGFIGHCQSSIS